MWEVFRTLSHGGIMMFVNLGISVVALTIVLIRIHALWFKYRMSISAFTDAIVAAVSQGNFSHAIQTCTQNNKHPVTRIVRDLLVSSNLSDKEIERAYEDSAGRELPSFKRFTAFLPQAGNLATLVGLLGTIQGLIEAFGGATAEDAATRQQVLAKGITVAFYNTFFGLAIAVFCALTYVVINGRQGMLLEAMESAMNKIRTQILMHNKTHRRTAPAR
jgi:biopolymer transport protein ExbB/TolQ